MKTEKPHQNAYIAITALVILCAFTLILAASLTTTNITDLKLITSEQLSNEAFYAADSCAEEAMLRLKRDTAFETTTLNLNPASCTISTVADEDQRITTVTGVSGEYTREIESTVNLTTAGTAVNVAVEEWKEE